jgi:hypothetical protein
MPGRGKDSVLLSWGLSAPRLASVASTGSGRDEEVRAGEAYVRRGAKTTARGACDAGTGGPVAHVRETTPVRSAPRR